MIKCAYLRYSIIFFFSILFPLSVSSFANAADNIWLGSSSTFASDGSNWSLNRAPLTGDNVIFTNNSYSYECTWDITSNPDLGSFQMNNYAGTVTLSKYLTVSGDIDVNMGTLISSGSQVITVGGDWNFFTGKSTNRGDVDEDLDIDESDAASIALMAMDIDPDHACADMNQDNFVNILDIVSTLRAANSLDSPQSCDGGTFTPDTSNVVFDGSQQTIYGNNSFYDLTKIALLTDTLFFQAGSIQTILRNLSLEGLQNGILSLRSSMVGYQWFLDAHGNRNIAFTSVKDLKNINFVDIVTTNSTDDGNNQGVSFGGNLCVCREDKFILACSSCDGRRELW